MATALLEKQDVEQVEVGELEALDETVPPEYHWTVDAFMKASDAGVFAPDIRLELIQGRIFEIMGQSPRHSSLASAIADMLREAAGKQYAVREEKPIHIAFDGEPIPDISIVSGRQVDYKDRHPGPEDVQLLVELSVTTVDYDLGGKALLYSQAGIREYWVVLANDAVIVRHRQPLADGYKEVTRLTGPDTLSPLALPEIVWTINELLGRTEASEEN